MYTKVNDHWYLNDTLLPPSGYQGNFGFSAGVSGDYAVVGAFTSLTLSGSAFIVDLIVHAPTSIPTQPPAQSIPVSFLNIGSGVSSVSTKSNLGLILALVAGALILSIIAALLIYYCCCMGTPAVLKKKKKEEEDSPYTVHSYVGYSEMDEYVPPPPPVPSWVPYYPQTMDKKGMDKKGMAKDIDKADEGFLRKLFPYKVHSFAGYQEGMEMRAFDDNSEKSSMKGVDISKLKHNLSRNSSAMSSEYSINKKSSLASINENDDDSSQSSYSKSDNNSSDYNLSIHSDDMIRDLSFVEIAKQRYAEITSKASSAGSVGVEERSVSSAGDSLVLRAKEQYKQIKESRAVGRGSDDGSVSTGGDSLVLQAKEQYKQVLQSRQSNETNNETSYVNLAKQRYAEIIENSSAGDSVSVGSQKSQTSLVEQAKMRYMDYLSSVNIQKNMAAESQPPMNFMEESRVHPQQVDNDDATVSTTSSNIPMMDEAARKAYIASKSTGNDDDSVNAHEMWLKEVEERRMRAIEEENKARLMAQRLAAEGELKRVQERNRLKEEARLRAEEKARARFAMFKASSEQTMAVDNKVEDVVAPMDISNYINTSIPAPTTVVNNVVHEKNSTTDKTTVREVHNTTNIVGEVPKDMQAATLFKQTVTSKNSSLTSNITKTTEQSVTQQITEKQSKPTSPYSSPARDSRNDWSTSEP